jgi:hypothetical protein
MFGKSSFVVLSIFFWVVVSSISQFTSSDYTFAIFKVVLCTSMMFSVFVLNPVFILKYMIKYKIYNLKYIIDWLVVGL